MAIIKTKKKPHKFWPGCQVKNTLVHCWWECKSAQPLKIIKENSQKTKNKGLVE
jgi:hypothetical protein